MSSPRHTSLADAAQSFLRQREIVRWEPGDMTSYLCAVMTDEYDSREWFVLLNLGGAVLELPTTPLPPEAWIPKLPRGSWAGLRPLLAALGAAEGAPVYDLADVDVEPHVRHTVPSPPPAPTGPTGPHCVRCIIAAQGERGSSDYRQEPIVTYGGESLCLPHLNLTRGLPVDMPLVDRLG